jgi:hypothetical protein
VQWALTLHIYLSMTGFLLLFLFALTGLTLNHANFGLDEPRLTTSTLVLPPEVIEQPTEKTVGEHVRRALGIRSPLILYKEYQDEIELQFAAPGRRALVRIDRAERTAHAEVESRGVWGTIGDLHKGRDSGAMWSWIIDITAVLFMVSSLTGMITLTSLPTRRRLGFLCCVIGVVLTVVLYAVWVPK